MARHIERLTTKGIAGLKPGRHADGNRLHLQVTEGRHGLTRSWELVYSSPIHRLPSGEGRVRSMGAGPYPEVSIAEARQFARKWGEVIRDGRDPIDERDRIQEERRAAVRSHAPVPIKQLTLQQYALDGWIDPKTGARRESYVDAHIRTLKHKNHQWQWRRHLTTYVMPTLGNLPMASVTSTDQAMSVLAPIWTKMYATASMIRGRLEQITAAAMVEGLHPGPNPWILRGNLGMLPPIKGYRPSPEHYSAYPWPRLPELMSKIRERPEISARCLEFTFFTVLRSGEAMSVRWDQVDLGYGRAVITMAGSQMKGGKPNDPPFVVPLCRQAVQLLSELPRYQGADLIFPGVFDHRKQLNVGAMSMLMHRLGHKGSASVHGSVRSGFNTWASESTQYPQEVVDMALHHRIKSQVEAAYRRGDLLVKRTELMTAWGDFLTGVPLATA